MGTYTVTEQERIFRDSTISFSRTPAIVTLPLYLGGFNSLSQLCFQLSHLSCNFPYWGTCLARYHISCQYVLFRLPSAGGHIIHVKVTAGRAISACFCVYVNLVSNIVHLSSSSVCRTTEALRTQDNRWPHGEWEALVPSLTRRVNTFIHPFSFLHSGAAAGEMLA